MYHNRQLPKQRLKFATKLEEMNGANESKKLQSVCSKIELMLCEVGNTYIIYGIPE